MKFSISKDSFLKGLQTIQSVISTHSTIPILYNVLITAEKGKVWLSSTDLSVSMRCSIDADVKKSGASTFLAKRLLGIIREMPQDTIEIEVDEKDVASIQCGASSYKIFGLSADEYPPMPVFEEGPLFTIDQMVFKEMLRKTVYAASVDESRQILNGILMSFKNQKLTMVATDGRRLALVEQEIEIPADISKNIVIPTKTVNELIKTLKEEGVMKIQSVSNMVAFDMESILIVSKLIDGNYPNFQQVIPSQCDERVAVERESLLSALRRAALLTNEKYPSIKITFEKNQMQIFAVTPDVGEAREILPMKYSGKSVTMAFNPDFLMDPLKTLATDEVFIELIDDLSPAVLKCSMPFLYVLMPLRLN